MFLVSFYDICTLQYMYSKLRKEHGYCKSSMVKVQLGLDNLNPWLSEVKTVAQVFRNNCSFVTADKPQSRHAHSPSKPPHPHLSSLYKGHTNSCTGTRCNVCLRIKFSIFLYLSCVFPLSQFYLFSNYCVNIPNVSRFVDEHRMQPSTTIQKGI